MGLIIGPTPWWQSNLVAACPEGTTLLDGSRIICKAGGTAWIVAPSCTQVSSAWAGGQYDVTEVGDKCCIFEWPGLEAQLIQYGFNPCDWFVPSRPQLQNPGFDCRTNWDSYCTTAAYWSSTECTSSYAYCLFYSNGGSGACDKSIQLSVRAFRCVTY